MIFGEDVAIEHLLAILPTFELNLLADFAEMDRAIFGVKFGAAHITFV
ncbi:hypothetical protein IJJ37_02145 [Candidatus Saccharibacteria bacterium]|nr:hypothetical protein [Candidatus Saccharibacteria bacterium]MBQ6375706.1 hypothetical protein [Candidatus Saccharibacteria bacterium]